MKQKVLLISTCKEKFHELEFVKPIENILAKENVDTFSINFLDVTEQELSKAQKVIICGTSLQDFNFEKNIKSFSWLKKIDKPVLGICAGMQTVGLMFGGKEKTKEEIGFFKEKFKKTFLGIKGEQEVWHLHNNFIDFSKMKDFEVFCEGNKIPQAVKHRQKEIYGVLFHPEVRQKEVFKEFLRC